MRRVIICTRCKTYPLGPEDIAAGFHRRQVELRVKLPPGYSIRIYDAGGVPREERLTELRCDGCGQAMPDGTPAVAITDWNENREGEPGLWETSFLGPEPK